MIHTVNGFDIVNEAEVNVFLELVSENWNVVNKAKVDVFLELVSENWNVVNKAKVDVFLQTKIPTGNLSPTHTKNLCITVSKKQTIQ